MIRRVKTGWQVDLREAGGRRVRETLPTKKLADEFERKVKEDRARTLAGLPIDRGPITYNDLCELVLKNRPVRRSDAWFEDMLNHSRRTFGKMMVRAIRPEDVGAWLHALDRAPKTKQHILRVMRQVLQLGVEWGYLSVNPVRSRVIQNPAPRGSAEDVHPFESWREVLEVAAHAGAYGPLIRFACATGLRPQEWRALRWKDIDTRARTLVVSRTLDRKGKVQTVGKTDAALRTVMLSRAALAALKELPTPIRRDALVFVNITGRGPVELDNWRKYVWKPALRDAGVEYRPLYQMRHTYATLALAQGAAIEWVSKQMGHVNIETTIRHYARFTRRVDDRELSKLDLMEGEADGRHDQHQHG